MTTGASARVVKKVVKNANELPPLPKIKDLMQLYRIRAKRQLSQNFILDYKLTNKIVKSAGGVKGCHVCEVGPGPGNLTRSILGRGAKHVVVIEKDRRFIPSLELLSNAVEGRMKIILGDVMDYNMENIFPRELSKDWNDIPPPLFIIGNLPFNVSTPLIIRWLRQMSEKTGPFSYGRTHLTLTFQKEVAERLITPEGSTCRCRLSVMCQYLCYPKLNFLMRGSCFVPPPDVDVGVVSFIPRKEPLIKCPFPIVEKVNRTLFHHRQKSCIKTVRLLYPKDRPELTDETFQLSGVNPDLEPFKLTVEEIGRICNVYQKFCEKYPDLREYSFR